RFAERQHWVDRLTPHDHAMLYGYEVRQDEPHASGFDLDRRLLRQELPYGPPQRQRLPGQVEGHLAHAVAIRIIQQDVAQELVEPRRLDPRLDRGVDVDETVIQGQVRVGTADRDAAVERRVEHHVLRSSQEIATPRVESPRQRAQIVDPVRLRDGQ